MVKRIRKVGNSHSLVLEKALMEQVGLREGAEVDVKVSGRSIVVTPVRDQIADAEFDEALDETLRAFDTAFKNLAK